MQEKGLGQIATISGRFYSMDRDKRWERVSESYNAMVNGIGEKAISAISAIEESYQKEIFDEFVKPTVITNKAGEPIAKIEDENLANQMKMTLQKCFMVVLGSKE